MIWEIHHAWLRLEEAQLELQMTSDALRTGQCTAAAAAAAMDQTLDGLLAPYRLEDHEDEHSDDIGSPEPGP